MENKKKVVLSEKNWNKLWDIKRRYSLRSIDEVVGKLLLLVSKFKLQKELEILTK